MDHLVSNTARATGITAYLLLFATVALGLLLSGQAGAWWRGVPISALHRFVTRLLGIFLAAHVLVLLGDSQLAPRALELIFPPLALQEPVWTTIGVAAVYLLALVALSTSLRRRLPSTVWYGVHLLTYPAFVAATAHGIMVGSETPIGWMQVIYIVCAILIGGLLMLRFTPRDARGMRRILHFAPGLLVAVAISAMIVALIGIRLG